MDDIYTAYIGLGSNLGDRLANLCDGAAAIHELPGTIVDAPEGVASIYESSAQGGPPDQPAFLNTAIRVFTELDPFALLNYLAMIEERMGRVRHERWGPRTIDLDILLFEDHIIDTPELHVPHARLQERLFVLEPLCEIAPELLVPRASQTVRELYTQRMRKEPEHQNRWVQGPEWFVADPPGST